MERGWWIAKLAMLGLICLALIGFVVMNLWNWLVPELFHGPVVTFWQALGLLLLSKILFSSFGGKSHNNNGGAWKYYWKKKLSGMTPDDKERFKQKMKEKWCNWENKNNS